MKQKGFNPDEIIFSITTACNLHCEHCFVNRNPQKLDIEQAKVFLRNCAAGGKILRVGFTGGEPFLYMDFLLALTKETVTLDLMFDQIMTNGDWWKNESDLNESLQTLYDAGYDGKIGLSWDEYHGQTEERMTCFINAVQKIFGEESISIQQVEENHREALRQAQGPHVVAQGPHVVAQGPHVVAQGPHVVAHRPHDNDVKLYTLPRTYPSTDTRAWQDKNWFKEDYCQGPGNIFFVHTDGNIAPCCGFANENPALFIGKITDSYETLIKNAEGNNLVQICFNEGLSHYRCHGLKKMLKARHEKLPGRTSSICSFCDYICRM